MRSTFKVLFYVNGSKEKNGLVPIMGRITINGQVAQFSCKRSIDPKLWDTKANQAKGKSKEAQDTNHALDNIKAQIIKHYQRIADREAYVSADMVRNAFQGIGNEYETLLRAFDKEIADFKKRVGKDRTKSTYNCKSVVRKHLGEFIRSHFKRADISMNELTEDFIRDFCIYLRNEVGLTESSVWIYSIPLKSIVTRAHHNGRIARNPFALFRVSPNVKPREFLTETELKTMMRHKFADPSVSFTRDMFVFGAFTGISFIDIKQLTEDQIVEIDGCQWVVSKRQKTKSPYKVKLLDIPLEIIRRYEPYRKGGCIFPMPSYQKISNDLKRIAKTCGLEKNVTFHQSRHTFGTLAVSKGVPIETVSKILGHSKITTTQIYAKMTNEKIAQDMDMFSKKLNKLNRLEDGLSDKATIPPIIQMPSVSRRSRTEAVN
jgi:integrase